jgi:hypothetical protein
MNITTENLQRHIQQYVLGQLSEDQANEFEEYFLCRPDVAEQVEIAQSLNIGLATIDTAEQAVPMGFAASVSTTDNTQPDSSVWSFLQKVFVGPAPSLAMAALLVLMAPMAFKSVLVSETPVNAELVRFDVNPVRSALNSNAVDLSAGGDYAAIMLRVPEVIYPQYRARVLNAKSGDTLWQSDDFSFKSGSRDHLLLVPPKAARADVTLTLTGVTPEGKEVSVDYCGYTDACM